MQINRITMKRHFYQVALIALMGIAMGFVGCGKENGGDNNGNQQSQEELEEQGSPNYLFHYLGRALEPEQTIYFYPDTEEVENDWATVEFTIENTTDAALSSVLKVELVQGDPSFEQLSICYGTTCKTGMCPWVSDAFTLQPGINDDMVIKIDYHPLSVQGTTIYKVTVGTGSKRSNPQRMFIELKGEPSNR